MSPYLLREEIQILRDKWEGRPFPYLYPALSDLLFSAGKIPAAMNLLEHLLAADDGLAEGKMSIFPGEAVSVGIEDGHGWFRRGLEYADACLYEEAAACLKLALESGYDTFETHYCLAGVNKSLGRLEEAECHCRKSLDYNPAFSLAFILLGSITKLSGRLSESADAVQKALLIDPDCAPAHYDLACYLSLSGETSKALAALEIALAKGFCDLDWMHRDPDLNALRALPAFSLLLRAHTPKKS